MSLELLYDPDQPNRYKTGGKIRLKLDTVRVEVRECVWLRTGMKNNGTQARHNCALQAKVLRYPHANDAAPSPNKIFDILAENNQYKVDLQPGYEAMMNLAVRIHGYREPYHRTASQLDRHVVGYIGRDVGNLDSGLLRGVYTIELTIFSDEEKPKTYEAELEVSDERDDFDFRITKFPRLRVLVFGKPGKT